MTLWIRTQDKKKLYQINEIGIDEMNGTIRTQQHWLGSYNSIDRCIEILDDIQNKLQNKFLCKPNCFMKAKDIDREEQFLNHMYKGEFIMQPTTIDIEPINCDVVIYEMPSK